MQFPEDFTADDIMEFEYEHARWADEVDGRGQYWAVNALLQEIAEEQRPRLLGAETQVKLWYSSHD